jgi:hypothetical protein
MTPGLGFDRLERHLHDSWLIRTAGARAEAAAAAVERSATADRLHRFVTTWSVMSAAEKVRAVAVLLAAAASGHLLLLRFVPAHLAPRIPQSFWVLVAAMAVLVASQADRLPAEWEASTVRRVWRTIMGWPSPGSRKSAPHRAP